MLKWLIIGGGIHGTHLAHVFVNEHGISSDDVRIIDPHDRLLAMWNRRTENTGMRYLRSPRVHHIDLEPRALEKFARKYHSNTPNLWINPYYRPSYDLFQQHCDYVIETYQLDKLHIQGQALSVYRIDKGWCVETENDQLIAENILLATGKKTPLMPDWAETLIAQNAPIQHVLDMTFNRDDIKQDGKVIVLGGGISAGQVALKLMNDHDVTLVTRQPLQQKDFDSSPCWLGPACLKSFGQADHSRRRWMIGEARQPGTLAHDIHTGLKRAMKSDQLVHQQDDVVSAELTNDQRIALTCADGSVMVVDHLILATGLKSIKPTQSWLSDVITRYDLPVADCGYPILSQTLRWSDGLYVTGPLAELEIGPASANIIGARLSAKRLQYLTYARKNAM